MFRRHIAEVVLYGWRVCFEEGVLPEPRKELEVLIYHRGRTPRRPAEMVMRRGAEVEIPAPRQAPDRLQVNDLVTDHRFNRRKPFLHVMHVRMWRHAHQRTLAAWAVGENEGSNFLVYGCKVIAKSISNLCIPATAVSEQPVAPLAAAKILMAKRDPFVEEVTRFARVAEDEGLSRQLIQVGVRDLDRNLQYGVLHNLIGRGLYFCIIVERNMLHVDEDKVVGGLSQSTGLLLCSVVFEL
mmetsp:Transcript_45106/g.118287  ORF Transcript_45106/g.118287 Transcript_45106/m.118287 type:complete len:240 (-) Transcript_45106:77-796(-)